MGPLPLLRADDSLLLILDMQTRPASACAPAVWTAARDRACALALAADVLALPVVATRQRTEDLGDLDPEIAESLPPQAEFLDKTAFAAPAETAVEQALAMTGRTQVAVCGMEAHTGVVQTVSELTARGYAPFVIADAICAAHADQTENALARMRAAGIAVLSAEAALSEWLRDSAHPQFQHLLAAHT